MKNLRSPLFAASLALTLLGGCGKKEDPVKVIEEAEASLPPAEPMPPGANSRPGSTAAGSPAIPPGALPAGMVADESYETWFKKHGLNLQDPKMLDGDADGDGSSNRDEFMADSDPRDPNSRPGIHQQIRLKEYTEVRLPMVLESVGQDGARVRRLDGEERTETVKVGETVKGSRWKVEKMEARRDTDKHGDPIDLSRLVLSELDTKEQATLMKDLPTRTGNTSAELTSPDGTVTLRVREGETFRWPDANGAAFKVIDLRADQVVVQELATRKMWTVPKQ